MKKDYVSLRSKSSLNKHDILTISGLANKDVKKGFKTINASVGAYYDEEKKFGRVPTIENAIKEKFTSLISGAAEWGRDMLDNFINGIKDKISAVTDAVKGVANTVKDFLGFSEPKEGPLSNFHTYAPDMMKLFAQGITDNEDMLKATVTEAFDFQGSIESGYATTEDNGGYEETIISLLQTIAERSGVQIDVNSEGIFNLVRSKNYEYSKRTGRSAFV